MTQPGVFIVMEGADGSGKSTQFRLIVERLKAVGHAVEVFKFPQYDQPSSSFVKAYLNGNYGPASGVSPYTASMFYALDRYHASPRIKQSLSEGKVVVADRYVGSNMAHQGSKFTNFAEQRGFFLWEDSLEFELLGIPRPDINIFLKVPIGISLELMGQRPVRTYTHKKLDQHEADSHHLEKTTATYDLLCKLFPKDYKEINCAPDGELLGIVEINNLIWESLKPLLPQPKGKAKAAVVKLNDEPTDIKLAASERATTSRLPTAISKSYKQTLAGIAQLRRQIQQLKTIETSVKKSALALTMPLDSDFDWLSKIISEPKSHSIDKLNNPIAINQILDEIATPKPSNGKQAADLKLLEVKPRNELDLLEEERGGSFTYSQKHAALQRQLASGFNKISYSLSGTLSYRIFKNFLDDGLVVEPNASYPSALLGHESLPEITESPHLNELLNRCFNLGGDMYSQLMGGGYTEFAPKVLLAGHLNRWRFKLNLQSLADALASSKQASGKPELKLLVGLIAEVHPTVAKALEQPRTSKSSRGSKTAARG